MPSWRPATASDPDEHNEWRFHPLADADPDCATRLIDRFAPGFLQEAGLPMRRLAEVRDTVNLVVADSWDPADGARVLRLTSWYTGETRWLHDWDGQAEAALSWIDECAEVCGGWVQTERTGYGNRTPWGE